MAKLFRIFILSIFSAILSRCDGATIGESCDKGNPIFIKLKEQLGQARAEEIMPQKSCDSGLECDCDVTQSEHEHGTRTSSTCRCVDSISKDACTFVPGDSKHLRRETMERAKNPHHCVSIVKQTHPDASGATFEIDKDFGDSVPGNCFADFGIIGLTEKSRFQTCKFGLNGSKDDTSNWFWCCTKVRVHDTADSRFRTGPNSRPNLKYWGTLPNEDKDEFSRRNCDVVVGGASKSKCKIDPSNDCTWNALQNWVNGPPSPNGKEFKNGCDGAVWQDGKPSELYCLGKNAEGKYQPKNSWYVDCCRWKWSAAGVQHYWEYYCAEMDKDMVSSDFIDRPK